MATQCPGEMGLHQVPGPQAVPGMVSKMCEEAVKLAAFTADFEEGLVDASSFSDQEKHYQTPKQIQGKKSSRLLDGLVVAHYGFSSIVVQRHSSDAVALPFGMGQVGQSRPRDAKIECGEADFIG